jgi:hypothetical protein
VKPLTGWPRKGSVASEIPLPWRFNQQWDSFTRVLRWFAGFGPELPTEDLDNAAELHYHATQLGMEMDYRRGEPNVGLPREVVQTIQWMAGTPQFLDHSGLQIVPVTDEQKDELERYLADQRRWRAEPIAYSFMVPELRRDCLSEALGLQNVTAPSRDFDLLDPWNREFPE